MKYQINETVSVIITLTIGLLSVFFGGKGKEYMMHISGKPLVIKYAKKEIGLFRAICIIGGIGAVAIGVKMLLDAL